MNTTPRAARTVDAPYALIVACIEPDLIEGGHIIKLNTDAMFLPSRAATLDAAAARELSRHLAELADELEDRDNA